MRRDYCAIGAEKRDQCCPFEALQQMQTDRDSSVIITIQTSRFCLVYAESAILVCCCHCVRSWAFESRWRFLLSSIGLSMSHICLVSQHVSTLIQPYSNSMPHVPQSVMTSNFSLDTNDIWGRGTSDKTYSRAIASEEYNAQKITAKKVNLSVHQCTTRPCQGISDSKEGLCEADLWCKLV